MNILLTGSEGFIGSNLIKYLDNPICLDLKYGDDLQTCELPENIDLVIHLAGLPGVRQSLDNPSEYWKQNVIVSQRIFETYKDSKILYASSSTAKEPWKNPYAFSKFSLEKFATDNSLGMRFTTTYGPNGRENMLIPKIINNDIINNFTINTIFCVIKTTDIIDKFYIINTILFNPSNTYFNITDKIKIYEFNNLYIIQFNINIVLSSTNIIKLFHHDTNIFNVQFIIKYISLLKYLYKIVNLKMNIVL